MADYNSKKRSKTTHKKLSSVIIDPNSGRQVMISQCGETENDEGDISVSSSDQMAEDYLSLTSPLLYNLITLQSSTNNYSPLVIENKLMNIMAQFCAITSTPLSQKELKAKENILDIYCSLKAKNDVQLKWVKEVQQNSYQEGVRSVTATAIGNTSFPVHMPIPNFEGQAGELQTHLHKMELYFKCHKITDEEQQKSILLSSINNAVYKALHRTLSPVTLYLASFNDIIAGLKKLYSQEEPMHLKSLKFQMLIQQPGQTVSEYISLLQERAYECKYTDMERRIVEQVFKGINDNKLRERLLEIKDVTLADVISISMAYEVVKKSANSFNSLINDNAVRESNFKMHTYKKHFRPQSTENTKLNVETDKRDKSTKKFDMSKMKCYRCGDMGHTKKRCKFSSFVVCATCGRRGHVAITCYNKTDRKRLETNTKNDQQNEVTVKKVEPVSQQKAISHHLVEANQNNIDSDDSDALSINTPEFNFTLYMMVSATTYPPIMLKLKINNILINFEMDTGSSKTVISSELYKKYFATCCITPVNLVMHTWNKATIVAVGSIQVQVTHNNKDYSMDLLILNGNGPALLGRDWLTLLNIQGTTVVHTLNNQLDAATPTNLPEILKPYAAVFSSAPGLCRDSILSIRLKPEAKPIALKYRAVPLAQRKLVEDKINEYVRLGIYVPVSSSEWQTPTVNLVKKDGSVRICGDYSGTINKHCVPDNFPIPTYDEVFSKLAGQKYYTKMDFTQAYNQMPLDLESSLKLTLTTHRGLYRPTRLPQGLTVATSLYQREIDTIFAPIRDKAIFYLDDMVGGAKTLKELFALIIQFLTICEAKGLKLNWQKCIIGVQKLEALGYVLSQDGITPTADKITPLLKVPAPKDAKEVQILIGFITYYERFLHDKATLLAPLYDLLKNGTTFSWTTQHQSALDTVKQIMSSNIVLAPFLSHLNTCLATDASSIALGAVLSQVHADGERPIAYASRVLSSSEKNYSMVELEALAVIYGILKFHFYLAGRAFTVLCDNKPVVSIFKRGRALNQTMSPRLLRWCLILQDYDYEIIYRPGLKNANADLFSRLCNGDTNKSSVCAEPATIYTLHYAESSLSPQIIKKATRTDNTLEILKSHILNGRENSKLPPILLPYKNYLDGRISVLNGILMYADRVIVPEALIPTVLEQLHQIHAGISRTKALARSYFFWPSMDRHIEEYIGNCITCSSMANATHFPNSFKWPPATEPWQRLHLDFLGPFLGTTVLLVIDAFSGWLELFNTNNSQSTGTVTNKLDQLFVDRGIPDICVTDNGPCFSSEEFKLFLLGLNIKHITTSPYTPQANGLAERAVQTVKHLLKKQPTEVPLNKSLRQVLSVLRNTPNESGQSPAELLNGRRLKNMFSKLHPTHLKELSSPELQDHPLLNKYNIHDRVFYRIHNKVLKWSPGIIDTILGNKMYEVRGREGKVKRHVSQIKKRVSTDIVDHTNVIDDKIMVDKQVVSSPTISVPPEQNKTNLITKVRRSSRIRRPKIY